jgi:hypothetical protein
MMGKYKVTNETDSDGRVIFIVTALEEDKKGKAGMYLLLPSGSIAQIQTANGEQTFQMVHGDFREYLDSD